MIINGDALLIIDNFIKENFSIDHIICDPPYGISRKTNFHTMGGHKGTSMDFGEWDKNFDIIPYIEKFAKITKQGGNIVIFNDWKNIGDIAKEMIKNGIEPKRCLIFNKTNPAPFNRDRMFINDVEFAVWGVNKPKGKNKWIFNRENNLESCIIKTTVQSKKLHPTMKDLKIIDKLVKTLSNPGDIIFDPFAGSGTLGVVCRKLDRKYVLIEKEEEYFNTIKQRLGNTE